MLKSLLKNTGLALITILLVQAIAFAQGGETPVSDSNSPETVTDASFKARCNDPKLDPPCASSPAECISKQVTVGGGGTAKKIHRTPINCIFLEEPIGGDPGYDLFRRTPIDDGKDVSTVLWYGEAIVGKDSGPYQAVLVFESGKENQGPFGLLYNYLGLVYNFLSGIIIAFVILVAIIGGIRMTTSAGNQEAFSSGRSMIIKAMIGMVLWFTASVILYTINPTFFAF